MIQITLPHQQIVAFCQKWQITEFALFGSVLRPDFRRDSDIDVLVTFAPNARWTLLDHVDMQDELQTILNRKVDLISKRGIQRSRNPSRRQRILNSAQVIYAQS